MRAEDNEDNKDHIEPSSHEIATQDGEPSLLDPSSAATQADPTGFVATQDEEIASELLGDGENLLHDPEDAQELAHIAHAAGENSNPAIAVDEMLSDAMLLPGSDLLDELPLVETKEPENLPTFQVKVTLVDPAQRETLKKIVLEQGLGAEEIWQAAQPLFTRLNEYQTILLLQDLRLAAITAHVEVKWPLFPMPNEDDMALGALAEVMEPAVSTVEGAPSVQLPTFAQDVFMLTNESLTGYQVQQVMGLVTAHKSIARRFFKEQELQAQVEEEIQKYPGKKPPLPKNQLERLFRELFQDLQKNALRLGANAVVSVKIEVFPESSHLDSALEQMRLVALGTAAVVEKSLP